MIVVGSSSDGAQTRILARGNFSLDASGLALLLLALGIVTLGLAALLAMQGFWPVLVIAVLQLALVAWLLIRVWENTWVFEEISIDRDSVTIVHQRFRQRSHRRLASAWATIRVLQPKIAWLPPTVVMRSGGNQVVLGAFLTIDEKLSLANHLSQAVSGHRAWRKH